MKRNKYAAKATEVDGIRFDSKGEAMRYMHLKLLQRAGQISNLRVHVLFPLEGKGGPLTYSSGRRAEYEADFVYEEGGQTVIEDYKGVITDVFRLKRALMESMGHTITLTRR